MEGAAASFAVSWAYKKMPNSISILQSFFFLFASSKNHSVESIRTWCVQSISSSLLNLHMADQNQGRKEGSRLLTDGQQVLFG
jgi:hypothetical protein